LRGLEREMGFDYEMTFSKGSWVGLGIFATKADSKIHSPAAALSL
jgi:hypothetical protein